MFYRRRCGRVREFVEVVFVFINTFRLKEKLAVFAAVLFGVFSADAGESLTDCSSRFISGEDALANGADGASVLDEFGCVRTKRHD